MIHWGWLIGAVLVGGLIGFGIFCVVIANDEADSWEDWMEQDGK